MDRAIFASFFFVDQNTKSYLPNELVFKLIMMGILAGTTLVVYLYLRLKTELNWLLVAGIFLFINCVFDSIFLIGLFKYELIKWVLTVLPIYIVIFFGLASFELKRKSKTIDSVPSSEPTSPNQTEEQKK